jgi:acetolactate synthase-1/2/3 large subunit
LLACKRPLVIAGGSGWDAEACAALQRFAENWQLPVGCGFRFQDTFDNRHRLYAGDVGIAINSKLAARVRDADLIIALGVRLGEMTTSGYSLLQVPRPSQKLVHVHAGAEELGRRLWRSRMRLLQSHCHWLLPRRLHQCGSVKTMYLIDSGTMLQQSVYDNTLPRISSPG